MRRYRSRGAERVDRICDALRQSGARVVAHPSPDVAPYEIGVETPEGEHLDLVCYAFTANKYTQRGRPENEHRFQVKYGGSFHEYHELYIDPQGCKITLFLGVGIDEDAGIFVACDPAMHSPTWFSRSIEFKARDIEQVRSTGWHGWERERSDARRKRAMPMESLETEILLGFTPEHFLRYVQLERIATGMDPGERLLLIDQIAPSTGTPSPPSHQQVKHELEQELGYGAREILDLIGGRFRLRAAARGAAAESHLQAQIRALRGITRVSGIDEDARPDLEVVYRDRGPLYIECKNVLRRPTASGAPRVDFQKTRASKGDPCSRYYRPEQFHILAACLHPVTGRWEYRFRETRTMDPHPSCPGHLSHRVVVEGSLWATSLDDILEQEM